MKIKILPLILMITLIFSACGKSLKENEPFKDPLKIITKTETETNLILPGNSLLESGIKDISLHSGKFNFTMSGYKGELFIGIANERFYGTILFFNWGNGVPQPLSDLKVNEDKIYFKRLMKTKEDLIKYGGTAYFEQDFYGIFTADRKTIKGYYRYTGTQDNWEALKKIDTKK